MITAKSFKQSLGGRPRPKKTNQQLQKNLTEWFNIPRYPYSWVWNGRPVDIIEFASLAYGDTKQRTMFLLEYGAES